MSLEAHPPRLAEFLLRVCTRQPDREFVIGDLAEEYRSSVLPNLVPTGARQWYWQQVRRSILPGMFGDRPRSLATANGWGQDFRHALRSMVRRPGLAALVIGTLGLGVGASCLIFSVVDGILLRPLSFGRPDRLIHVYEVSKDQRISPLDDFSALISVRPGNFHDWKQRSHSFGRLTAYRRTNSVLTFGDRQQPVLVHRAANEFFETLDVPPTLGRTFMPADYALTASPVAILSNGLWLRSFGGDDGVIGRSIHVDGVPHVVVGVMPRGFYPTDRDRPELWIPLPFDEAHRSSRSTWGLTTIGRLRDGVALPQARRELDEIASRLESEHPENRDFGVRLIPVTDRLLGNYRRPFVTLTFAVGFLLLIACVNVSHLLLMRGFDRQKELALRLAIGASRARLFRQLLTESVVWATTGGLTGLVLALVGLRPFLALLPSGGAIPRVENVSVDLRVICFAFALCILTGIGAGLIPAVRASGPDLAESLKLESKGSTASRGSRGASRVLVALEVALSLCLLSGAGLMIRSFLLLERTSPGFRPEQLLAIQVRSLKANEHSLEQLCERIVELPGVQSASLSDQIPVRQKINPWTYQIKGLPQALPGHEPFADIQTVSPDYFGTLGIPLLRGRVLMREDQARSPRHIVINERMASAFGSFDPVGREIAVDFVNRRENVQVVGVVANAKLKGLRGDPWPEMFWPIRDSAPQSGWILVRTSTDASALTDILRSEILRIDSSLLITETTTMGSVISESLWQTRFLTVLLLAFGALSLIFAAAGTYGVLSYAVRQRFKEIAVRMALGASRESVVLTILRQGLAPVAFGAALGTLGSLVANRFLSTELYGISPTDPLTLAGASLVVFVTATIACYLPAHRAATLGLQGVR